MLAMWKRSVQCFVVLFLVIAPSQKKIVVCGNDSALIRRATEMLELYLNDVVDTLNHTESLAVSPNRDLTWKLAYLAARSKEGSATMREIGRLVRRRANIDSKMAPLIAFDRITTLLRRLSQRTAKLELPGRAIPGTFYKNFRRINTVIKHLFDLDLVRFFELYNHFTLAEDIQRYKETYDFQIRHVWIDNLLDLLKEQVTVNSTLRSSNSNNFVQVAVFCDFETLAFLSSECISYLIKGIFVEEFYNGITLNIWNNDKGFHKYGDKFRKFISLLNDLLNSCQQKNHDHNLLTQFEVAAMKKSAMVQKSGYIFQFLLSIFLVLILFEIK